jgi:hypothetical protein
VDWRIGNGKSLKIWGDAWLPPPHPQLHFWSNRNHFPVDYYFRPYQTPENTEIIFQKSFYAETNGA